MTYKIEDQSAEIKMALEESAKVKLEVANHCIPDIIKAAQTIVQSIIAGGKILICGNGGSAADAQHFATEFTCRLSSDFNRPPIAAIALTTDTSFLTAFPNDYCFEDIFARQVQALAKPNDILIGISTSGNSENIVRAVNIAKKTNIKTIALCGNTGKLQSLVDITVAVPSNKGMRIQEAHLAIEHLICYLVERQLFLE